MELRKIENLLEKYDRGETSIAEERELKAYFLQDQIPVHLEPYRMMFGFSRQAKDIKMTAEPRLKISKNRYIWASVAASIILVMGLFLYQNNNVNQRSHELGTIQDEEIALEKAKETLRLVSEYMNEGTEDLIYLQEFNKTKNKFISKN